MIFHTKTLLLLTCLLLFHAVSFHIPGGFGFFVFRERVSCTCCWSRFSRCVSARASLSSCGKAKEESSDEGKAPGTGNTERMKSASSAIGTAVDEASGVWVSVGREAAQCLFFVFRVWFTHSSTLHTDRVSIHRLRSWRWTHASTVDCTQLKLGNDWHFALKCGLGIIHFSAVSINCRTSPWPIKPLPQQQRHNWKFVKVKYYHGN